MIIAIHESAGSYSDRWIEYCRENSIQYKIVNCYRGDIIEQLRDCDALMWHWNQYDHKAVLFARQLIYSVEEMGLKVFPDSNTCWHFDDKVGQKYLLEAVNAPLVQSYIFYDKQEAMNWISHAEFPKVFKLRGGSASANVRLVKNRKQARAICRQAFGKGFKPVSGYFSDFRTKTRRVKKVSDLIEKLKRLPHSLSRIYTANMFMNREKGYLYFQDFIPDNEYDTRIVVIGDKALGLVRRTRKNDFRASGSGAIEYEKESIDERFVTSAFRLSEKLQTQSLACDFVFNEGEVQLLEISYAYAARAYDKCVGFWDREMNWHQGHFKVEDLIMEMFIESLQKS